MAGEVFNDVPYGQRLPGLFRTQEGVGRKEDAWLIGSNRFKSPNGEWVPLYEGKMVQAYDHRAADITVNEGNLFRPGQQESIQDSDKRDPKRSPNPRYYVKEDTEMWPWDDEWIIAFKDITAATNMRTMISAVIPRAGAGHTLPRTSNRQEQSEPLCAGEPDRGEPQRRRV